VLPSHADKQLLLDADDLSVSFGAEQVLQHVSMCVHRGEFIGLIGPNGAGKTTLLKALLGLLRPQHGTVKKQKGMVVGYIPQRGSQAVTAVPINVMEVVLLGAHGNRTSANDALQAVRMADMARKRFADLSGGQQQRVMIAQALASQPDILFLDEPTTGIDEHSQAAFYTILHELQERGIAIVMVSHDVDTVLTLVTRVICLNGSIVYDGAPEHFESDKHLPDMYKKQHMLLHHHHGHAAGGAPDA